MTKLKQVMQRFFVYSYINKQEANFYWKRDFNLSMSYNKVLKTKEDIAATLSYFTAWQSLIELTFKSKRVL